MEIQQECQNLYPLLNKSALAKPKNARTEGLCALVRVVPWDAKAFGWIFGRVFFATFF
jgi:hypothetical protein